MQWKARDEPTQKKFKNVPSAGKVMLSVLDSQGVLLTAYFPEQVQNINKETYFDTLIKLL